MPLSVQVPFPVFQDRDGQPLDAGYVWIGQANLPPQTNQLQVYFDRNLTIPAAQPLRTLNGYISNAGTPAQIYLDAETYSILVQDKKGTFIYGVTDITGADINEDVYINVKSYGATGNGTTNDTSSVQNCLNQNQGKTIIFPSGTYKLNPITVPANTFIIATGAILDFSTIPFTTAITFVNGGGIDGGEIFGAGGSIYNGNGTGIKASGTNNYPLAPTYITCPKITNVKIRDFSYAGIDLLYVRNANVNFNEVYDCGYAGIQGQSLFNVNIDDNIVHDIAGAGAPDSYGIAATSGEQNSTATPRSQYVSICRNKVYNVPNWEAIDTHGGSDIVIDSNIVTNCRFGIMVVPLDTEAGSQYLGSQRVIVTNNVVTGTGNGSGITAIGGTFERAQNIVVSNNILTNCGTANNASDGAIRTYNVSGLDIVGNVIRTPYVTGINLISDVYYANVVGNIIIDPRDDTNAFPRCIAITSNNVNCSIHSNQLTFNTNSVGTYVAILGIVIAGGLTGLDVNIGQNSYIGIAANKLSYSEGTSTGVYVTGMMTQKGSANINLTNVSSVVQTVTFSKIFPSTPQITLIINGSSVPGSVQKQPIISVYSITAASFDISVRPFDLTAFGGVGTLVVDWVATL